MAIPAREHKAKIRPRTKFRKLGYQPSKGYEGIRFLGGPLKGGNPNDFEIQAIHFDAKKFSAMQAKEWLRRHKYRYELFNAASVAPTS